MGDDVTPYEKALCEAARLEEREKIAANLDLEAAAIRKNGEGLGEPKFHWLAAERTEMIADQIRRGVL